MKSMPTLRPLTPTEKAPLVQHLRALVDHLDAIVTICVNIRHMTGFGIFGGYKRFDKQIEHMERCVIRARGWMAVFLANAEQDDWSVPLPGEGDEE